MQVYKVYFKAIYKNMTQIAIYFIVFLVLVVVLANTYTSPTDTNYTETKVNIVFINYDKDSKIVEGLKNYLSQKANIVNIEDNTQKLQDALFFREVEYIVKVPDGFTKGLLNGGSIRLDKTSLPSSTSSVYMDSIINKYLNTVKMYDSNIGNLPEEELIRSINKDLDQKTDVKLNSYANEASESEKCSYYFNYLAYSMLSILILGICAVMIVFNNTDLKKRNLCSPIKLRTMYFQLILGNLSFAIITWFLLIIASFIMYGSYMFTAKGMLFLLNSLIFTIAALSIAYLTGNVVKSKKVMSAVANVVVLGTCFISGVFVPQALLGKTVITIASFTPNYWYVKSNNTIASMVNVNMENLTPVFINMLIMIGFALAVLAITLLVIKQKRVSDS
ncbi:ABC transporter permease [Pseudobacteroides cellulosolvens]|uniref:ABC-2 type transporter transmembrane domain-containing protein n=1 Tax=Pseudobacteroides cellulosolvens ATCC 35603 = DSM 2933 TaxID=398512 RepID=A0A0L6JWF8_9FIRM|nr:ABC transporter permease [Pseudobacteroides cellulosolvens]KNY30074.1 hypothetical protein Bccel_5351 [Pseudobacteroides cellulosolvens ATCC 35603 = DSM 2933]